MTIFLRDDDCNYFTKPDELKETFSFAERYNLTVILGIIPAILPSVTGCVPSRYWNESKPYFVCENAELMDFLKDKNFRLGMHGIHHDYKFSLGRPVPELVHRQYQSSDFVRSRSQLEKAFDRQVEYFIPPSNKISRHNYNSLKQNNDDLTLLNIPSISKISRPISFKLMKIMISRILNQLPSETYSANNDDFGMRERGSIEVDKLKFMPKYENSDIIIATHYWEICESTLKRHTELERFLKINVNDIC